MADHPRTGPSEGAVEPTDGRRQRSERSRAAVIDALLDCYDDGIIRPSGAEIAARAGVSERSVFRHFTDLDALARESIGRQFQRVSRYFRPPSAEGDRATRIAALVDQRTRLHGRMANLARAAGHHAVGSPVIAKTVADRRRFLRDQVAVQFAAELDALPARDRRLLLAALESVVSLEGLDYLRVGAGIGPRDLKVVLTAQLTALLGSNATPTAEPSTDPEHP